MIGESPLKVYRLYTQQKDDGQHYFMMGFPEKSVPLYACMDKIFSAMLHYCPTSRMVR